MAAGDEVFCVGVLRIVLGEVFNREVIVEAHHGVEGKKGVVHYFGQNAISIPWGKVKSVLGKEDYEALIRAVEKLGSTCEKDKNACGRKRKKYDDDREDAGAGHLDTL